MTTGQVVVNFLRPPDSLDCRAGAIPSSFLPSLESMPCLPRVPDMRAEGGTQNQEICFNTILPSPASAHPDWSSRAARSKPCLPFPCKAPSTLWACHPARRLLPQQVWLWDERVAQMTSDKGYYFEMHSACLPTLVFTEAGHVVNTCLELFPVPTLPSGKRRLWFISSITDSSPPRDYAVNI